MINDDYNYNHEDEIMILSRIYHNIMLYQLNKRICQRHENWKKYVLNDMILRKLQKYELKEEERKTVFIQNEFLKILEKRNLCFDVYKHILSFLGL